MEPQPEQPVLQYGRSRKTRNRKFGRYDFERFDHLSSSHANIGHETFDKVNVNCRFLFKKSKWGVLGEHKNPAGIIYLDLTFDQPKDSRLHSATVFVTLDDEDEELDKMRGKLARRGISGPQCPVQMTDCYGPKGFAGPERIVYTKRTLHLTPNVQIAGHGIGGMGLDKESSIANSSRWRFSGQLLPGKGNHWSYKTLKWELSENDAEVESSHSSAIHTAFTFEHSGQPFFMRVEIKGKLKKLHGRLKDKMMKFPSSTRSDDSSVVTLINFGDSVSFKTPLDERARELQFEMEMANMNAIPMQVSDPQPATFSSIINNSGSPNHSMSNATPLTESWNQPSFIASNPLPQQLSGSTQAQFLQGVHAPLSIEDATDPTLANLAQAFIKLQTPNRQSYQQTEPIAAHPLPSELFPNVDGEEDSSDDDLDPPSEFEVEQQEVEQQYSEEQVLVQLLRMPGLLAFLRMIAVLTGLLGFLSQTPSAASSTTGSEGESPRMKTTSKAPKKPKKIPRPELLLESAQQEDLLLESIKNNRSAKRANRQREKVAQRTNVG